MASRRKIKEFDKEKFSIILVNYNSENYIDEALQSIIDQDYSNIELIITDDCSKKFPKDKIDKKLNSSKVKNIKEVKYVINKENIGTVKTMNKALKLVSGSYVLIFASDDKLANDNVISNYVKIFDDKKVNVITSNWIICDDKLNKIQYFEEPKYLKKFNHKRVKKLHLRLCKTNILGAGSTCYRKMIFDKYGYFDENFKYLEDWPYWIKLTKNNERIYYANFDGLLHRSGGISSNFEFTSTKKKYAVEILSIYKNYILSEFDSIPNFKKVKIIKTYINSINFYAKYIDVDEFRNSISNYLSNNKKIILYFCFDYINLEFIKKVDNLFKNNIVVPISFCLTSITIFLLINLFNFNINKNNLLLLSIFIYIFCYCLSLFLSKFIILMRGRIAWKNLQ